MNKEWKDKWVTALRSGKYEQGQGQLATLYTNHNTKYCCLGVLCDIHPDVREVRMEAEPADGTGWIEYYYGKEWDFGRIPIFLREKLNIDAIDEDHLINMNDGEGIDDENYPKTPSSFELIADYIEKEM
jgi:hypothetical protein